MPTEAASTQDAGPLGHRERLIAAMATSIEERGYRETTVADVVRLARTSRRNFYEHFDDRDGCFLALFDAASQSMLDSIAAAVDPESSLEGQVDSAVEAYKRSIKVAPAYAVPYLRLADLYVEQQKIDDAKDILQQAQSVDSMSAADKASIAQKLTQISSAH